MLSPCGLGTQAAMTLVSLLLPLLLGQAAAADPSMERLAHCIAAVEADNEAGYEEAMRWAADTRDISAYRCAAMAVVAQGRYEEGGRRLESLAVSSDAGEAGVRAAIFSQAGNAYLLARAAARARAAFTQAITLAGANNEALPDLLIDRARAYAMERDWRRAEEDLSHALDLRADDALALRLRAETRMRQNAFDLAEADAAAAVRVAPRDVDAHLVLGHVREAKRTGQIPEN